MAQEALFACFHKSECIECWPPRIATYKRPKMHVLSFQEHRILLTGTPLQNNVDELFSLLNFLEPAQFPSQGAFLMEFGNLRTEAQVERLQAVSRRVYGRIINCCRFRREP